MAGRAQWLNHLRTRRYFVRKPLKNDSKVGQQGTLSKTVRGGISGDLGGVPVFISRNHLIANSRADIRQERPRRPRSTWRTGFLHLNSSLQFDLAVIGASICRRGLMAPRFSWNQRNARGHSLRLRAFALALRRPRLQQPSTQQACGQSMRRQQPSGE
jgi:hypothetical protein